VSQSSVVLPAVHVLVELSAVVVVPVGDAASAVPPTPGLPAVVPVVVPVVLELPEADGEPVVLVVPAAVSEPVPEADAGLTLLVPSKAEG